MPSSASTIAETLLANGRLEDAIAQLSDGLRTHPTDGQLRSALFELLSFAGDYIRADKQLAALASGGPQAEAGVASYRAALEAERIREHMFDIGDLPAGDPPPSGAGTINGQPFTDLADGDPRIGARLEVIAGGRSLWIPFTHLASVVIQPPVQLRDLRWLVARIATNATVKDLDLGEVLLPAMTPAVWRSADPELRLGRATDWEEQDDGSYRPVGQKVLRVDDRYVPLVDVRTLLLTPSA